MYCGSAAVYLSFARFAASANRRVLCFGGDNYYISGMTMSLGEKDGRARATKPAAPRAYPSTKTIARTYVDFRRVARNEKGEEESAGRGGGGWRRRRRRADRGARWESATRIDDAARRGPVGFAEADDAANSIEMHKNRSFQLKITVVAWMAG
jgi:hypothetical protein